MNKYRCLYRAVVSRWQKLGVWAWAIAYIGTILVFAGLYYAFPDTSWKGEGQMDSFIDCLYFSVVTITSLGFGDVYPYNSCWAKIFVSAEAVGGILIIGFFLNDVAQKQAIRLDKQNRDADEEKKAAAAMAKIKTYRQVLRPVFERYLRGAIMMVTPFKARINMKVDAFHYDFKWQFSDMCDLYMPTFLMSSDFYEPAVNAHFKNQEVAFNELRNFVISADLSYWPKLEELIYCFIRKHHEFQFQDVIVNNGKRPMGEDQYLKEMIRDLIKKTEGEPVFSGDMTGPYVALYYHLKDSVNLVKGIYAMMEQVE